IDLFNKHHPSMLDELRGLADALDWEMADALREFGGYYVDYAKSGCSILTGNDFMIRNYDSHPAYYEGRYVIYKPTDNGYLTLVPSIQITGRTDGLNEKELAVDDNFLNRLGTRDGLLRNIFGLIYVDTCWSVV